MFERAAFVTCKIPPILSLISHYTLLFLAISIIIDLGLNITLAYISPQNFITASIAVENITRFMGKIVINTMRLSVFFASLKKRRWIVMLLMGMVVIIMEAYEHVGVGESIITPHFLTEVITYGIVVPTLGSFLIIWLDRAESRYSRVKDRLSTLEGYTHLLGESSTREELINNIVQLPKSVLPAVTTCLAIYNVDNEQFTPIASWAAGGYQQVIYADDSSAEVCDSYILLNSKSEYNWQYETKVVDRKDDLNLVRHLMPLVHGDYRAGLLVFDTLENAPATDEQLEMIFQLAPEMALSIDNFRLNALINTQREGITSERQRIARDLHDTLGQNISILRLKLDQVCDQNPLGGLVELQNELGRMREIADEAYDQMRRTLADLHPDSQIRFDQSLRSQVKTVSERAGFDVVWSVEGTPRAIYSHDKRQILYICREAFNNIERHAHATQVQVNIYWGQEDLSISISDNGCGFEPIQARNHQSYGLTIMSERAEQINGELTVDSKPDQGTTVSLRLPVPVALMDK